MKPQTLFIPVLASLAVLAPRAGLAATPVSNTENVGTIGNTGELSVASFQLAQTSEPDSYLLSQIAVALAEVGQFDRAMDVAQSISDDQRKASVLIDIAETLAESGQKELATEIIEETIALVGL